MAYSGAAVKRKVSTSKLLILLPVLATGLPLELAPRSDSRLLGIRIRAGSSHGERVLVIGAGRTIDCGKEVAPN